MAEVEKKTGRIDILVNYAGDKSDSKKPSLSLSIADVSRSFATNALSAVKISMLPPLPSLLLHTFIKFDGVDTDDDITI